MHSLSYVVGNFRSYLLIFYELFETTCLCLRWKHVAVWCMLIDSWQSHQILARLTSRSLCTMTRDWLWRSKASFKLALMSNSSTVYSQSSCSSTRLSSLDLQHSPVQTIPGYALPPDVLLTVAYHMWPSVS